MTNWCQCEFCIFEKWKQDNPICENCLLRNHASWCPNGKKSQMTREEASRKIRLACPSFDGRSRANFISSLEALGLIKFEEEKIKSIDDCLTPCFGSFAGRDAVKKALDEAGYKIVRK